MREGQAILVRVQDPTDRWRPVPDVILQIALFKDGKRRYAFSLPPSSPEGIVRATYLDLEKMRLENSRLFIMDYNTPLDECDDVFSVVLRPERDLVRAIDSILRNKWNNMESIVHEYGSSDNKRYSGSEELFQINGDLCSVTYYLRPIAGLR
jgi:hypothetical protein